MATNKTETPSITKKMAKTIAGNLVKQDAARNQALGLYETALRLMQEGKFEKAHAAFNKLMATAPTELSERIRMYISACTQQMGDSKNTFSSNEEQYDYAISLLNNGHYDDARQHLQQILKNDPKADYAFYGMAVLASMTGESENCLQQLAEAIGLNARNRIQARSDSDFQDMLDDPRFTELLYPES
ncbi:MAG TPA: tetratricopeptide repeat protein [Acidobacteriaceae bacterium]